MISLPNLRLLEARLHSVRAGRWCSDVSFDTGVFLGYLSCLNANSLVHPAEYALLKMLLTNAQEHAMADVRALDRGHLDL
jgi:hypothetical protein